MNGRQMLKEFVKELSVIQNMTVTPSFFSRSVFQLKGKLNGFIYIKTIAKKPHRWGITRNTVDKIIDQKNSWCIILLHDFQNTGYVISSKEYRDRVANELWPFHQGDYKITEKKSIEGVPHFSTIDELIDLLSNIFL